MIIGWAKGVSNFQVLLLEHWNSRVRKLISSFTIITLQHIYPEQNYVVDSLSKTGIGVMDYYIHLDMWKDAILLSKESCPFG